MFDRLIQNITDVPGVEGVCLFDFEGKLAVNYLPDFFVAEMMGDLSRRIISLFQTVDESYLPCNEYLLMYSHKLLSIRRGQSVYILLLCDPSVSFVSLRMVVNLALKNITPDMLESAYNVAEPPPASATPATPRLAPTAVPSPPSSQPSYTAEPAPVPSRSAAVRPKRTYRGSGY